ncbi:MAG TPA: TonB family protein [Smithellaceae bacterium]|nr:TonB family protein [Smithellaceae bacterium]
MTARLPHRHSQGNSGNSISMFFLSLLLHAFVLTVMIVSLPAPTRTLTFGGPYAVSLVGPDALLPQRSAPSLPAIPAASTLPATAVAKQDVLPTPQTAPIRKDDDILRSNIDRAIDAIRQRQSQFHTDRQNEKIPQSAGDGAITDAIWAEYSAFVQARIKNNWSLPDTLRPRKPVLTIIEVRITRDGGIEHIAFEKRSGNAYYDESALRAVQKSAPFPPLPAEYRRATMDLGVRFPSSELQ